MRNPFTDESSIPGVMAILAIATVLAITVVFTGKYFALVILAGAIGSVIYTIRYLFFSGR